MKLKIMIMALLLLAGIGSAVNYLPESIMEPSASLTFDGGNINDVAYVNATTLSGADLIGEARDELDRATCTITHEGNNYVARFENGTVIATTSDTSIGNVSNLAIAWLLDVVGAPDIDVHSEYGLNESACLGAKLYYDIWGEVDVSDEPIQLYSFMDVSGPEVDTAFGMGSPFIMVTEENQPIFFTDDDFSYRFINIHNMGLINNRTGTDYVTVPMVSLYKTGYSYIHHVFSISCCDYDKSTFSGILFDGMGESTHFLNKISDSHIDSLWLYDTDNTWIDSTQFCSWGSTAVSLGIVTSDDVKVTNCHFCVPEYESAIGIYIEGNSEHHNIVDNVFEVTAPNSSVLTYGICGYGNILTNCMIDQNLFINFGCDISLPYMYGSSISGNEFRNSNYDDAQYKSSIWIQSGNANNVNANIGYKPIDGTDTYLIWGCDYSNYLGNIAKGYYDDVVVNVGTGSNEAYSLLVGA